MKLDKLISIILLTLIVAGGAYFIFEENEKQVKDVEGGQEFLPSLSNKVNSVQKVIVTEKDQTTTLWVKQEQWVVSEKQDYLADFSKVKKLLLDLADLKTIESKTSKPENYGRLGVQPPGEDGEAASRQVEMLDKSGNSIYSVILGKTRVTKSPGGSASMYARIASDQKSWLVSGSVALPANQKDWLDKYVIDIKQSEIQSVKITHPDNSILAVAKAARDDKHFTVEDLNDGAELKSESVADSIARTLENMTLDDIKPRGTFSVESDKITQVSFTTFEGLVLNAKLAKVNEKQFIWFDTKTSSDDEKVKKESQALNEKFALWVYEIPAFKANEMSKKLEDLLDTAKK